MTRYVVKRMKTVPNVAELLRKLDEAGSAGLDLSPGDDMAAAAATEIRELRMALEESVKLQSHYAKLLNMYDGGARVEFATADEWRARLQECGVRTVAKLPAQKFK